MPKKVSLLASREQPIHWKKAIACGMLSATLMMAFVDTFCMLGLTPFSFELYLGSLIRGTQYGHHNWTVGFLATWVLGGIFGIFYAYCFEYLFEKSSTRLGIWVGVWHAIAAAVAFFPFFSIIHNFYEIDLYPHFGLLGSGLGASTFILLITAHLLFGACMGLFYGGVRATRIRDRFFEPGEVGLIYDLDRVTAEDDPEDRIAV